MSNQSQLVQNIRQGMDLVTHRSFRQHGRFIKSSGLSGPQFGILMQLHYQRQCGVSDISNRMEISNAAASQLVEKLVQGGLLERDEDPNDRRAKKLKLTAKGQGLVQTSMEERHRWVDTLIARLDPAERQKVGEAMEILVKILQATPEEPTETE